MGEYQVKQELCNNGPFVVTFEVFDDFMNYGSGVYSHSYGAHRGYHAVVIVGYGYSMG